MNSKKLNILIIFCLTLFCFAGGFFGVYKFNQFKALDIAHDMQNASHRQQAEQEALNNIKTQSTNETNNNKNILKPNVTASVSEKSVDVSAFNFLEMYTHAEQQLNKATNIYSTIEGKAFLSGPTSRAGISFNNDKATLTAVRAQNSTSKYVDFKVNGTMLDGLFNLDYEAGTYFDGSLYYWFFNQDKQGWLPSSQAFCYDKLRFDTNQTFNIVNASSIKAGTGQIFYNKYEQIYTGSCELIPSVSAARYSYTLQGILDAENKADVVSSKLEVTFDKNGNFKTIRYIDTFKVTIVNDTFNTVFYGTISSDYTETFISIGSRNINIQRPYGI